MSVPTGAASSERPRIAVKLSMLRSTAPLVERFAVLRDAGLDGVELAVPDAAAAAEVDEAAAGAGLAVATLIVAETFSASLVSGVDSDRDRAVDALRRNVAYAHDLGVGALMFSPGFARPDEPLAVFRDRALVPCARWRPRRPLREFASGWRTCGTGGCSHPPTCPR